MIVRRLPRDVGAVAAGLRAVAGGNPVGTVRMLGGIRANGRDLSGVVAGAAARRPDAVAVVDDAGPVTTAWLDTAADRVADVVHGRGHHRVGVMVGDHRGFVVAVTGVLRARADAVLIGPCSGVAERAEIARREGLAAVLRDPASGEDATVAGLVLQPLYDDDAPRPERPSSPRVVVLSAGTTGAPTAATGRPTTARLVPQLGLLAETGIRGGEPVLVLPPLFHGHGLAVLVAGLLVGAPVVLARGGTGSEICAAVTRHDVAVVTGVPVHLHRWAEHLRAEHLRAERPRCPRSPTPRRVVSGSARLSPAVVDTLVDHLGPVVVDMFGSTQTGTLTVARPADLRAAPGTVGRPAPGVRLAVVDDAGRRLPAGEEGAVALVTVGRTVPTGDLGVIAHGRLFLRGRTDDVVVCGGENVRLSQVSAFLAAQPGVSDVVVGAVGDPVFDARLVADVVLDPRGPLVAATAPDVLRAAVRSGLARHKVPVVRVVDELPRCAVGKPRAGS